MNDMIDVMDPVVEVVKDWCMDAIQNVITHAPQYTYYIFKALKGML